MKLTHSNRSARAEFIQVLCTKGMCSESWFGLKYINSCGTIRGRDFDMDANKQIELTLYHSKLILLGVGVLLILHASFGLAFVWAFLS